MKKILSLMLAMMLFLLPAAGLAEAQEAAPEAAAAVALPMDQSTVTGLLTKSNFAAKYMLQGQELTTDTRVTLSPAAVSLLPEEVQQPVSDLLEALTFRSTFQATEGQAQAGGALLLNGETAVDLLTAADGSGFYATSNLIGDTIVRITRPQVKELGKTLLQQAVDRGQLTQSQADTLLSAARQLKADPMAFLAKAFGSADFTPVMEQIIQMVGKVRMESMTEAEAPEFFPEAAMVITVPVVKDDLNTLGAELAKFLLDMPAVQKVLPYVTVNNAPMTAEQLTQRLSTLGNVLAEDAVLQIYANAEANVWFVKADANLNLKGTALNVGLAAKLTVSQETGAAVLETSIIATDGETTATMYVTSEAAQEDETFVVKVNLGSNLTKGETSYQPVEEKVEVRATATETSFSEELEGVYRLQLGAEGQPVGITFNGKMESQDAGDHAEGSFILTYGLEGAGDLIQISSTSSTAIAEAYIITEDATEPLSMSDEELKAFVGELQNGLMPAVFGLIAKLPESCQQIVMQLMMGSGT